MSHQRSLAPIVFHRSGPMACPYLDGRTEQQLFMELGGPTAQDTFEHLSQFGYRRSHHIVYRPTCIGCDACVPVRIRVKDFEYRRRFRKILNRGADMVLNDRGPMATREQYQLFSRYVQSRHGDGDMAGMSFRDYSNLVVASPVDTRLYEWRNGSERLMATCIVDQLKDGLSAVYSFFEPKEERLSLGGFIILSLVERAKLLGLPYVYLGFWVEGSDKMNYKIQYKPLEGYSRAGWREVDASDK